MATAGAGTEHADFPAHIGEGAEQLVGAVQVAEDLFIGDTAAGAHFGADIFRGPVAVAEIEIGRNRDITMMGESTGALTVPFIPAGRVVNNDHPRKGTGAERRAT